MPAAEQLSVYCLCAAWCGVCRDFRQVFEQAGIDCAPLAVFKWIDIEDHEALLDDLGLEIDNFPTLLIRRVDTPLFFGSVTPHAQTVVRLAQVAAQGKLLPLGNAMVTALGKSLD